MPTVGAVRNCHRIFTKLASTLDARRSELQQRRKAAPTPQSVLSRSLLNLSPEELKGALNARINAETIFSPLMLTIAAGALIEIPDAEACDLEFGITSCDHLRGAYLIAWGIASAGFSMACLVTLGSMQLFFGHASAHDVHDRYIGGETYINLSQMFITSGLVMGLLPGLCLNLFLRFPQFHWSCGIVSSFHWLLYAFQVWRGIHSVRNIYAEFPGFSTMSNFFQGYLAFGKTIELTPRIKSHLQFSADSLGCQTRDHPMELIPEPSHAIQDDQSDLEVQALTDSVSMIQSL